MVQLNNFLVLLNNKNIGIIKILKKKNKIIIDNEKK